MNENGHILFFCCAEGCFVHTFQFLKIMQLPFLIGSCSRSYSKAQSINVLNSWIKLLPLFHFTPSSLNTNRWAKAACLLLICTCGRFRSEQASRIRVQSFEGLNKQQTLTVHCWRLIQQNRAFLCTYSLPAEMSQSVLQTLQPDMMFECSIFTLFFPFSI